MNKCFRFFATGKDMLNTFGCVKLKNDIAFIRAREYNNNENFDIFLHASDIPDLGILPTKSHCMINYIITNKDAVLCANEYIDSCGEKRKSLSQQFNPHSVAFSPSGVYIDNSSIIHGQLGTIHDNNESLSLLTTIYNGFKSQFKNYHGWFIGPEALSFYDKMRFITISVDEPYDYDFKI